MGGWTDIKLMLTLWLWRRAWQNLQQNTLAQPHFVILYYSNIQEDLLAQYNNNRGETRFHSLGHLTRPGSGEGQMRRMSITNPMDILRDRFMRANKRKLLLVGDSQGGNSALESTQAGLGRIG